MYNNLDLIKYTKRKNMSLSDASRYYELMNERQDTDFEIGKFIEGVNKTLLYWYLFHKRANIWAMDKNYGDGDLIEWLERDDGVVHLGYTEYHNIKDDLITSYAENNKENYYSCSVCNGIYHTLYGRFCDCGDDYDDCTEKSDLVWYIEDVGFGNDMTDQVIFNALVKTFKLYRDNVSSHSGGSRVEKTVKKALGKYDNCESNDDLLTWLMSALGIMHHNGNICNDYGDRYEVDNDMVNIIRSEGIAGYFEEEDILEFIEG